MYVAFSTLSKTQPEGDESNALFPLGGIPPCIRRGVTKLSTAKTQPSSSIIRVGAWGPLSI